VVNAVVGVHRGQVRPRCQGSCSRCAAAFDGLFASLAQRLEGAMEGVPCLGGSNKQRADFAATLAAARRLA
jgi:hypothetical protein